MADYQYGNFMNALQTRRGVPEINVGAPAAAPTSGGGGGIAGLLGKASPAMMGLGVVSSLAGAISGFAAAKQMRKLSKQVPQYSRSQFPQQMLGQAQQELNANPFQAAQARAVQGRMGNRIGAAQKAVTDPSQMLNLIGAYGGAAADEALNQDMANYAQRGQRLNDVYNAQMANYREDQNVYDNTMTAFNSKVNLTNAANQTRTGAFQNMGSTLMAGGKAFTQFRK
jgi:hypothetical protein